MRGGPRMGGVAFAVAPFHGFGGSGLLEHTEPNNVDAILRDL